MKSSTAARFPLLVSYDVHRRPDSSQYSSRCSIRIRKMRGKRRRWARYGTPAMSIFLKRWRYFENIGKASPTRRFKEKKNAKFIKIKALIIR